MEAVDDKAMDDIENIVEENTPEAEQELLVLGGVSKDTQGPGGFAPDGFLGHWGG